MPANPPHPTRTAFTLIELLVVIAIVALLTGILLPTLNGARALTRRAVCASNLRQLAIANLGYAAENRGAFVLAAEDMFERTTVKRWHGERDARSEPFDPARGPLADYLGDGGVKQCPSFTPDAAGFEAGCGGYGYNADYIGGRLDLGTSRRSATTAEVAQPAATVMFTDAGYLETDPPPTHLIEYSFCRPPYRPDGSGRWDASIHFRHRGVCNVAWVDGHVDHRSMDFTAAYQGRSLGEQAVRASAMGWFGPDDRNNELFDLKREARPQPHASRAPAPRQHYLLAPPAFLCDDLRSIHVAREHR